MRHSLNRVALASPAAFVLLLCGAAQGQTALGDGHALDANLNATQGRINPRATGLEQQMRYNNAVINGTAPNGASFRGSVGYRAPDQFGGSVGSDTLYNFKRDSFNNELAASGVRASDALRYQFAMTTGQYVPGALAATPTSVERSGTVATGASSIPLRSTSEFLSSQSFQPTLVGARLDEQGAEFVAKASPLLGVTWVRASDATVVPTAPTSTSQVNPLAPNVPGESGQPGGAPTAPGSLVPGTLVQPTGVMPGAQPGTGASPAPGVLPGSAPGATVNSYTGMQTKAPATETPPSDRTNPALDNRIQNESLESSTIVHTQLMSRFREGFTGQATPSTPSTPPNPAPTPTPEKGTSGASPESNSLQDQLDRLHRLLSGAPEPTSDQRNPGVVPGSLVKPGASKPGDKPFAPDSSKSTTPPPPAAPLAGTGKLPTEDEKAAAVKGSPVLDVLTPEFMRGVKKLQEKKVEHFAEPAPGTGPDTSTDPEGYRITMRDGERLLAEGNYFDAEENFVRAIASTPNDPMARAGRIHAEIGAGLYLSAAANLRALLAASPEIAALRYADRLLPRADRSQAIVEQLIKQEKNADSSLGREASLLVAYMGYQHGDSKAIAAGLDQFAAHISPDASGNTDRALYDFLKKIWIQP